MKVSKSHIGDLQWCRKYVYSVVPLIISSKTIFSFTVCNNFMRATVLLHFYIHYLSPYSLFHSLLFWTHSRLPPIFESVLWPPLVSIRSSTDALFKQFLALQSHNLQNSVVWSPVLQLTFIERYVALSVRLRKRFSCWAWVQNLQNSEALCARMHFHTALPSYKMSSSPRILSKFCLSTLSNLIMTSSTSFARWSKMDSRHWTHVQWFPCLCARPHVLQSTTCLLLTWLNLRRQKKKRWARKFKCRGSSWTTTSEKIIFVVKSTVSNTQQVPFVVLTEDTRVSLQIQCTLIRFTMPRKCWRCTL